METQPECTEQKCSRPYQKTAQDNRFAKIKSSRIKVNEARIARRINRKPKHSTI